MDMDFKYKPGVIDLDTTFLIMCTLPYFLSLNPPCKECLIRSMCIKEHTLTDPFQEYLEIQICEKLKNKLKT